jgi:hypothetical protein
MTLDDLSWHDGVLLEWRFEPGHRSRGWIEFLFALYPEQVKAPSRKLIMVRCEGVRRFVTSCDAAELLDNSGPGNVVDGQRHGSILRVFVTGGFLEVEATSFSVRRVRKARAGGNTGAVDAALR